MQILAASLERAAQSFLHAGYISASPHTYHGYYSGGDPFGAHGDFITIGAFALIVPSAATQATLLIGDFHPVVLIPCIVGIVIVVALISDFAVFRPLRSASPATLMMPPSPDGSSMLSFSS